MVIVHRSVIHVVGTLRVPSLRSVDSLITRKRHTECAYYLTDRERLPGMNVVKWPLAPGYFEDFPRAAKRETLCDEFYLPSVSFF